MNTLAILAAIKAAVASSVMVATMATPAAPVEWVQCPYQNESEAISVAQDHPGLEYVSTNATVVEWRVWVME